MKIKKFIIKNYRNLKDTSIDFSNLTTFIGKNDVGKSNILNALDLFFNWMESGDYKEISSGGNGDEFERIVGLKDHRIFPKLVPTTIELIGTIELTDEEVNVLFPDDEIQFEKSQGPLFRSEVGRLVTISKQIVGTKDKSSTWEINSIEILSTSIATQNITLYRSKGRSHLMRNGKGIYVFSGGGVSIPSTLLNLLKKKFLKIPAIRKIEAENRESSHALPDGKYIPNDFLRYEKEAPLGKEETFEKINKDISTLFPEYKKITSKTEDNQQKVNIYFEKFPSSSVGSGINQLFVNIFNLDSYEDVIFGIEEVEIHLHPEAQRKVFDFLKERSEKRQIIITTHSPIFADVSNSVKLYLVKKNGAGIGGVKNIENKKELKSIKYELGAKNTDLFFYNAIVLIEGDTEERAFPILAEVKRSDFSDLGIKLINIKGKDKLGRIKEFLEYIRDSDVRVFVVVDKGENIEEYISGLIKQGLLENSNYHIWSKGAFVDCFTEGQVIQAMENICKEFNMTVEQLIKEREKKNKTTEKILSDFLHEKTSGDLNKPVLGEELALVIKKEIESEMGREKTEVEEIIEKIVNIVGE